MLEAYFKETTIASLLEGSNGARCLGPSARFPGPTGI